MKRILLINIKNLDDVDLRCYLRDAEGALSETWLYQWSPLPPA